MPASPENEYLPIVTQRELDKLKVSSRRVCQPNFLLRLSHGGEADWTIVCEDDHEEETLQSDDETVKKGGRSNP